MSADVIQMVLEAGAVSHLEKPGFPITCNSLEHLNKIDCEPVDHIDVLMSDGESRCQSVSECHSGQSSYSSSELNIAIDKEEFERIIPDMSMAGSSDSASIYILPDTKTTNVVNKNLMNAVSERIKECFYVMDDSNILQHFTSVAQKPKVLPSTSGSEMLFKSECESDCFDLHAKVYADDLNADSCSFMSLEDDSYIDDTSFTEAMFVCTDVFSESSSDGDDHYFSGSQNISVPCMEVDIDTDYSDEDSHIAPESEVLSRAIKILKVYAASSSHVLCTALEDDDDVDDSSFTEVSSLCSDVSSVSSSDGDDDDFSCSQTVEVVKPSSGHIVAIVNNWVTSVDSDHIQHFKTLPDQCVEKVFRIYNEDLHSIEEQESQHRDTAVAEVEETPAVASCSWKLKMKCKMPKLKNPFKKLRKGRKSSFVSPDLKWHCSTDANTSAGPKTEKLKKRSIFSRILSALRSFCA